MPDRISPPHDARLRALASSVATLGDADTMAASIGEARYDLAGVNLRLGEALRILPDDHPACYAIRSASFDLFTADQRLEAFVSWPAPSPLVPISPEAPR